MQEIIQLNLARFASTTSERGDCGEEVSALSSPNESVLSIDELVICKIILKNFAEERKVCKLFFALIFFNFEKKWK